MQFGVRREKYKSGRVFIISGKDPSENYLTNLLYRV